MIAAGRKIHKKTSFVLITSKYVSAWLKTQNLLKKLMMMIILHLWRQAQPAGETVSGRHYWQTAMPCALMILLRMMIIILLMVILLLMMMIMTTITVVVILLRMISLMA